MNKVKARKLFDTPVTEQSREQALIRGKERQTQSLHASKVEYLAEHGVLYISFTDHTGIGLPITSYPELAELSPPELRNLEVGFGGSALCLDSHDLHVSIAGLVSASESLMKFAHTVVAASNGRSKSEAKARAARENGQKGGRPRKFVQDFSLPPPVVSDRYISKETGVALYVGQALSLGKRPQANLRDGSINQSGQPYVQPTTDKPGTSMIYKGRESIARYVKPGNKTKIETGG